TRRTSASIYKYIVYYSKNELFEN
ncbi:hypothetical protein QE152_g40859, partial [Popillia japonica]